MPRVEAYQLEPGQALTVPQGMRPIGVVTKQERIYVVCVEQEALKAPPKAGSKVSPVPSSTEEVR
jgi:hypothetical protein